jgi:hypothetical protein
MRCVILIAAFVAGLSGLARAAAQPAEEAAAESASASPGVATSEATTDPAALEAARKALWASPEMVEAREWVLEYGRRSRQFGEQGALDYLGRVERLSPSAMRAWLTELNARRANLVRSNEVTQAARQRVVEQAFQRLQSVADEQANIARGREAAADQARNQLLSQQQFTEELNAIRQASRSQFLTQMYYGRDYSWLAFPDYRTRAAAAATLPGDLPPGDPNNFLRVVPIDANGNIVAPPGGGGGGAGAAAGAAAGGGGAAAGGGAGGGGG